MIRWSQKSGGGSEHENEGQQEQQQLHQISADEDKQIKNKQDNNNHTNSTKYSLTQNHLQTAVEDKLFVTNEFNRMGFHLDSKWRISDINENFELCNTYPRFLIIPSSFKDEDLEAVAEFRYFKRIPTAVWRHLKNGCFIVRSSQPTVGWFGWFRSDLDETLLQCYVNCGQVTTPKMLVIDARSYTAAMANRAKGGGCECSEYYSGCEVQFMNLANIHSIRKSFQAIRSVCEAYSEQSNNWLTFLDDSRWLHHISAHLKSALLIVDTIDIEEKSILIHCSDGWDRTPQLVALAEIMLDPYYRTFEGFKVLIKREWLDFGHKFADRCGSNPCNEDPNERCPVFLQWLDCVQQLLVQYPRHFEFNASYLDKLNRHTYSNVFGTFSYNSTQERILSRIDERLPSLWCYFDSSKRKFRNDKFVESDEILRPSYKVRDLYFWKEVYLPPLNRSQTSSYMPAPISNSIDNKKFCDSLYMDGLKRTVCK